MTTIRRLRVGEAQLLKQVRLTALRESPGRFESTYETAILRTIESWREQADNSAQGPNRATFAAFDGDAAVGMMALYRQGDTDVGEVIQAWIAPEYRRKGVGVKLVHALRDWAKDNRFRAVMFRRKKKNGAIKFTTVSIETAN